MSDEAPRTSEHRQLLWIGINFAIGGYFAYAFYVRYWSWRDCIAGALSSCVTDDGGNLVAGGQIWLIPAILFLTFGLWRLLEHARS